MSFEDLESLEATLQTLSDPRLMAEIREAEAEVAKAFSSPKARSDRHLRAQK